MTKEIKVGDTVVYNGQEAFDGFDGVINIGQIGFVRGIAGKYHPWPYYVDFGKGGLPADTSCTGADDVEFDCKGLSPMAQGSEINLYEGEAQ